MLVNQELEFRSIVLTPYQQKISWEEKKCIRITYLVNDSKHFWAQIALEVGGKKEEQGYCFVIESIGEVVCNWELDPWLRTPGFNKNFITCWYLSNIRQSLKHKC